MHACALVIVPPTGELSDQLDAALAPWSEDVNEDGWWDWWQIGGRFTGRHGDYDARRDPANWEPCIHCGGTGERAASGLRDGKPWCNCCSGDIGYGCPKGWCVKWPTQWVDHPSNISTPGALLTCDLDQLCFTIVAGEVVKHRQWYVDDPTATFGLRTETDDAFDESVLQILRTVDPQSRVVIVDYHS